MSMICEPLIIGIEQEPEQGKDISFEYVYSCDHCNKKDCVNRKM